ncbi:hypothetical protein KAU93_03135 [Candidatus Bathyarchaeota archaeon]|nr:hypothetical protein [Candidatus Bathyarchaeota archaeon]
MTQINALQRREGGCPQPRLSVNRIAWSLAKKLRDQAEERSFGAVESMNIIGGRIDIRGNCEGKPGRG